MKIQRKEQALRRGLGRSSAYTDCVKGNRGEEGGQQKVKFLKLFCIFQNEGFPNTKKAGPNIKWDSFPFGPSTEFGALVPSPQSRPKNCIIVSTTN